MDQDLLVKVIMDEVNKVLKNSPENNYINKESVVIFDNLDQIETYRGLLGEKYNVLPYTNDISECNFVIIPKLCLRGLANLANLTPSNEGEHFIIKMLMMGKHVYIMDDGMIYRRYKVSAPKQLYNKYLEFEKKLIIYGIEIVSSIYEVINNDNYNRKIDTVSTKEVMINDKISEVISKKLITESDIIKQFVNGYRTIVVSNKSMITPLAVDFINSNKITIVRNDGV